MPWKESSVTYVSGTDNDGYDDNVEVVKKELKKKQGHEE